MTYLFASPLARGLFARGICESFGFANKTMTGLADAEKSGMALAEKVAAHSLGDLRQIPSVKLLETRVAMSPIVDGWFLPANPYTMFAEGKEAPVPLLAGWNADEGATFPHAKTLVAYQEWVRQKYPDIADRLLELYPARTDDEARTANKRIVRDSLFAWGPWSAARLHAKSGYPTYLYYFNHPQPLRAGVTYDEIDTIDRLGTFHSSEYPYLFGTLDVLTRDWTNGWLIPIAAAPMHPAWPVGHRSTRAPGPRCIWETRPARDRYRTLIDSNCSTPCHRPLAASERRTAPFIKIQTADNAA